MQQTQLKARALWEQHVALLQHHIDLATYTEGIENDIRKANVPLGMATDTSGQYHANPHSRKNSPRSITRSPQATNGFPLHGSFGAGKVAAALRDSISNRGVANQLVTRGGSMTDLSGGFTRLRDHTINGHEIDQIDQLDQFDQGPVQVPLGLFGKQRVRASDSPAHGFDLRGDIEACRRQLEAIGALNVCEV